MSAWARTPMDSTGDAAAAPEAPPANTAMTRDFSALGGTRTPNLLIRSQMLYPIELRAQQRDSTARLDRGEIRRLVPSRSGGRVMKLEHPKPFVCRWHAKWMWNTRAALQLDTATRMVLADATDKVAMFRRELELDAVPASARAWPPLKPRAMSK